MIKPLDSPPPSILTQQKTNALSGDVDSEAALSDVSSSPKGRGRKSKPPSLLKSSLEPRPSLPYSNTVRNESPVIEDVVGNLSYTRYSEI